MSSSFLADVTFPVVWAQPYSEYLFIDLFFYVPVKYCPPTDVDSLYFAPWGASFKRKILLPTPSDV